MGVVQHSPLLDVELHVGAARQQHAQLGGDGLHPGLVDGPVHHGEGVEIGHAGDGEASGHAAAEVNAVERWAEMGLVRRHGGCHEGLPERRHERFVGVWPEEALGVYGVAAAMGSNHLHPRQSRTSSIGSVPKPHGA